MAWGQSHEILRPTTSSGAASDAQLNLNCSGNALTGSTMTNAFDAAGLSTSSNVSVTGSLTQTKIKGTTFKTWATPANTPYTALTINVNTASDTFSGAGGFADISYSLNAGSTWTSLKQDGFSGWTQVTSTATIAVGQDFTKIWVNLCIQGNQDPTTPGIVDFTGWDIWTDGTYTPAVGGSGTGSGNSASQPIIISMVPAPLLFGGLALGMWARRSR